MSTVNFAPLFQEATDRGLTLSVNHVDPMYVKTHLSGSGVDWSYTGDEREAFSRTKNIIASIPKRDKPVPAPEPKSTPAPEREVVRETRTVYVESPQKDSGIDVGDVVTFGAGVITGGFLFGDD